MPSSSPSPESLQSGKSLPAGPVSFSQAEPIDIRGLRIGCGRPAIIVPTTADHVAGLLDEIERIHNEPAADLIEWRIDYLKEALGAPELGPLCERVRRHAGNKPVLLTFRTAAEGGARAISDKDYAQLYLDLIEAGGMDLIDIEMFRDAETVRSLTEAAHAKGIKVVMSSHDFHGTPAAMEIVTRLRTQDACGADILKIAVMPRHTGDVLELLQAARTVRGEYSAKPMLVMSMGGLGAITRLAGEVFGSDLSFGSLGTASAPGQIEVASMRQVLDIVHQSMQGIERDPDIRSDSADGPRDAGQA